MAGAWTVIFGSNLFMSILILILSYSFVVVVVIMNFNHTKHVQEEVVWFSYFLTYLADGVRGLSTAFTQITW